MTEIVPMLGNTAIIAIAILAIPLGFLLGVVLFRAACDLCSVEPPRFLKSCLVVLVIGLVCAPIAFGIGFGSGLVGQMFHMSAIMVQVFATFACILPCALVAGALYIPLLRVGYLKGTAIYTIQSLLGTLVTAVFILFTIGSITIVQGISRLI
jgi:hypothetical protein